MEFEYPNGVTMFSQCRQTNGCQNIVGELVVGSKGGSNCANRVDATGADPWRFRDEAGNPYRLTHEDLIASILAGEPINEAQAVAESTMTGILGREAAYSGRGITWEKAMQSDTRLGPETVDLSASVRHPGSGDAGTISVRVIAELTPELTWSVNSQQTTPKPNRSYRGLADALGVGRRRLEVGS